MEQALKKEQWAALELSLLEGVAAGRATMWSQEAGGAWQFLEALQKGRMAWPNTNEKQRRQLETLVQLHVRGRHSESAERVVLACEKQGIGWVCWHDNEYPKLLRQIVNPPAVLYYKGNPELLAKPCVSIVGSRKAGAYGSRVAYAVAEETAKAGVTIVSGMAAGIDACAHKGALAGGSTAAVMPCGLDLCYPRGNWWLYQRVCEMGVAVSEYPPGRKTEKWFFLDRNRLISGLSLITFVAQAGPKSGSIRTAQLAAEQGREVFAAPGSIFEAEFLGAHNLLQDGANVLTGVQSLVKALRQGQIWPASEKKLGHAVSYAPRRDTEKVSGEEALEKKKETALEKAGSFCWLYEKIEEFGCLPERLCEITGRSAAQVQQGITVLELQGLIRVDEHGCVMRE